MSDTIYNISTNISEFERYLIQEFRKLQTQGYGDMSLKVVDGLCVDLRIAPTHSRKELETLQK